MQYDYFLKTDLYGNVFIEFLLENNIHGYNKYGEVFLNDLLDALGELKPTLKEGDKMQILMTSEKNSESILKIDTYLKDNILFNNTHSN